MVMNIDFAPTLLDMAGIEIPSEMQGEKLSKNVFEVVKQTKENLFTITITNGQFGTKSNHTMVLEQTDTSLCIFIIQWMNGNCVI